jgi:hypothetical protein
MQSAHSKQADRMKNEELKHSRRKKEKKAAKKKDNHRTKMHAKTGAK